VEEFPLEEAVKVDFSAGFAMLIPTLALVCVCTALGLGAAFLAIK
jgi:hypothetical protein